MPQPEGKPSVILTSVREVLSRYLWFLGVAKIEEDEGEDADPEAAKWFSQNEFGKYKGEIFQKDEDKWEW